MLLIDTSVWIPFFNDAKSAAADFLETALLDNRVTCINAIVEMEILQGIRDEDSFLETKRYLEDFQYFPMLGKEYYDKAVEIFRACRKRGITVRRSLDCVIAANCIIDGLTVVHQDRDFEFIKKAFPALMTIPL